MFLLKKQQVVLISASHNNIEWNTLKFFNNKGEFLTKEESDNIINSKIDLKNYSIVNKPVAIKLANDAVNFHINSILELGEVTVEKIKRKK